LVEQDRIAEAFPRLKQVLKLQPNMHQAWTDLAWCYQKTNQLDSALYCLRVSDGMNPYNASVLYNIGLVHYRMGNVETAVEYYRRSLDADSLLAPPAMGLALVYKDQGKLDAYEQILLSTIKHQDIPVEFYYELIEYYLGSRKFDSAVRLLSEGMSHGIDSTYIRDVLKRYPDLSSRIMPPAQ
jgi:tetratricopeptide (TPR) repeat protein